ncbi:hypothetical protein M8J77_025260 [Diaphorina citri]|nr:hypothetical protein M8J77_025260 [Diaphorina citri]
MRRNACAQTNEAGVMNYDVIAYESVCRDVKFHDLPKCRNERKKSPVLFLFITALNHNFHPKYLGVVLDRSLTFKEYLNKTALKLQTRNNLIQKLTNTSWGAHADVLRTSALALVYSTAEYCSPVWLQSCHTQRVDVQLNSTMRLISGTVRSTPTEWLPALSHIAPPPLRRKQALVKMYDKIQANLQIPLHDDLLEIPHTKLSSRKPPLSLGKHLRDRNFNMDAEWKDEWIQSTHQSPLFEFAGSSFPRKVSLARSPLSQGKLYATLTDSAHIMDAATHVCSNGG